LKALQNSYLQELWESALGVCHVRAPVWPLLADQVHPLLEACLNCKALQQRQGKVVAASEG
jgi:hypothetical protein